MAPGTPRRLPVTPPVKEISAEKRILYIKQRAKLIEDAAKAKVVKNALKEQRINQLKKSNEKRQWLKEHDPVAYRKMMKYEEKGAEPDEEPRKYETRLAVKLSGKVGNDQEEVKNE